MKVRFLFAIIAFISASTVACAQPIAAWTFEPAITTTTGTDFGPIAATTGTGSGSGHHASAATAWSGPSGNGSAASFSSNNWGVADYYQFTTSTTGFSGIFVDWDQAGSATGPRDFQFQYSTDGTTFTNFGSPYQVLLSSWNPTTFNSSFHYSMNLTSVTALNNQAAVFFRLVDNSTTSINGGTVAAAGTDRVDNFSIGLSPVPEPTSLALCGLAIGGGLARRWRSKKS